MAFRAKEQGDTGLILQFSLSLAQSDLGFGATHTPYYIGKYFVDKPETLVKIQVIKPIQQCLQLVTPIYQAPK